MKRPHQPARTASMKPSSIIGLLLLALPAALPAQSPSDSAAIRATALDYVEGWYEGNPERMTRALHPELVKRIVAQDTTTNRSVLQSMGASALVNGTRHGYGRNTPKDRQQKDVTILDIFSNARRRNLYEQRLRQDRGRSRCKMRARWANFRARAR